MMRMMMMAVVALGLTACAGMADLPPGASTAAAVADATLPPPVVVSPTAGTLVDDFAVQTAFEALDLARAGVDAALLVRPSLAGTPAARRVADALVGAKTWLNIADQAQQAGQAENYRVALMQASAALVGAKSAIAELRGK